jgi:hypothetical protein
MSPVSLQGPLDCTIQDRTEGMRRIGRVWVGVRECYCVRRRGREAEENAKADDFFGDKTRGVKGTQKREERRVEGSLGRDQKEARPRNDQLEIKCSEKSLNRRLEAESPKQSCKCVVSAGDVKSDSKLANTAPIALFLSISHRNNTVPSLQ